MTPPLTLPASRRVDAYLSRRLIALEHALDDAVQSGDRQRAALLAQQIAGHRVAMAEGRRQ